MHRSIPFLRFPKSNPYSPQTLLSTTSNRLFSTVSRLQSRAVVRFRGSDTIKFLHGLLTNDVRRFRGSEGQHPVKLAMYSALLTPQGRVLYDIFVYSPPPRPVLDGSFELLVDVDRSEVEEFLATLTRYRLRAKVEIENVAEEFSCWQWYGGDLSKKLTSAEEPFGDDQSSGSYSQVYNHGWQWFRDPRLDCLGYRGIFPSNTIPPLVEADKETDEQNYIMWRLENGIAESSAEIPKGEAIPLEYNLVGLHAISFEKGCYVGQELVARTHHRGVIRKRLVPLKFLYKTGQDVEVQLTPGLEVTNSTTGKKAGTITTTLGNRGLGLLRLDDAFKSSSTLALQGQDIEVEAIRPEWWPSEWSTEHQ